MATDHEPWRSPDHKNVARLRGLLYRVQFVLDADRPWTDEDRKELLEEVKEILEETKDDTHT